MLISYLTVTIRDVLLSLVSQVHWQQFGMEKKAFEEYVSASFPEKQEEE